MVRLIVQIAPLIGYSLRVSTRINLHLQEQVFGRFDRRAMPPWWPEGGTSV